MLSKALLQGLFAHARGDKQKHIFGPPRHGVEMDTERDVYDAADKVFDKLSVPCDKLVSFTETLLLKMFSAILGKDKEDKDED